MIGTHGRGVYILDDVTPLREWDVAQSQDFHLSSRGRRIASVKRTMDASLMSGAHVSGENPPYGADIDFSLKAPTNTLSLLSAEPAERFAR